MLKLGPNLAVHAPRIPCAVAHYVKVLSFSETHAVLGGQGLRSRDPCIMNFYVRLSVYMCACGSVCVCVCAVHSGLCEVNCPQGEWYGFVEEQTGILY